MLFLFCSSPDSCGHPRRLHETIEPWGIYVDANGRPVGFRGGRYLHRGVGWWIQRKCRRWAPRLAWTAGVVGGFAAIVALFLR